jgi:16S rRNA (guanine966-N2)-methyltransferase
MRITGGVYRSRTLAAPPGTATRPTSDRVREALFAILFGSGGLAGARVLDLYAGTGALALESLSRGAARATLVESSQAALSAIEANVRALGVSAQVRLVRSKVERAAPFLGRDAPFDLVFADPPYAAVASGEAARAVATLVSLHPPLLAPAGRVVLEHGKADAPPDLPGLTLDDTRRYGDTCLAFYAGAHSQR